MEADQIQTLAKLAKLQINDETVAQTAKSITEILGLVDRLQAVDTGDAHPMAHPLDAEQVLRDDKVTEEGHRSEYQKTAPDTENGLYLVPKVID